MIYPQIALSVDTGCFAEVEVWGHRKYSKAVVMPVRLAKLDVIAVVYYSQDFTGLNGDKLECQYYGAAAVFSIKPMSPEEFFADMREDVEKAFRHVVGARPMFAPEVVRIATDG